MHKIIKEILTQIRKDGIKRVSKSFHLGTFVLITYLVGEAYIARESMFYAKEFDWSSPLVRLDLIAILTAMSIIFIYVWFTVVHFETKIIKEYSRTKMFAFVQATIFALSASAFVLSNHFGIKLIPQELSDLLYDIKDIVSFTVVMLFLLDALWFSKVLIKDNGEK